MEGLVMNEALVPLEEIVEFVNKIAALPVKE